MIALLFVLRSAVTVFEFVSIKRYLRSFGVLNVHFFGFMVPLTIYCLRFPVDFTRHACVPTR